MKALSSIIVGALALSIAGAQAETSISSQLTEKDLSTADGSCRVGLQTDNHLVGILTATEARVKLSPDSWSSDDESINWTNWLTNFDDSLYSRWLKSASTDGQQTVSFKIVDGAISVTGGTYLQASGAQAPSLEENKAKFEATLKSALEETLKNAAAMPQTKNKLKEVQTTLTFMRDQRIVPTAGKKRLGFVAVANPDKSVQVWGTTNPKDGRSPGIQIMQERGKIDVIDVDAFKQKCQEIESAP
jgi:hypothetical protein